MSLISLVCLLIVIGVLLWIINTYLPMNGKIRNLINAVLVIALILWLLRVFGILGSLGSLSSVRIYP
jgi:hypothetical protein